MAPGFSGELTSPHLIEGAAFVLSCLNLAPGPNPANPHLLNLVRFLCYQESVEILEWPCCCAISRRL